MIASRKRPISTSIVRRQGDSEGHLPLPRTDWAKTMDIPKIFSRKTMECIKNKALTKNARVEIVNAVYSRMLQFTRWPSSEEYTTVSWRLVEEIEELKDQVGSGMVRLFV